MKVYFYHTQHLQTVLPQYREGRFPGHLLYGATLLGDHGMDVVWHRSSGSTSRLRQMLRNTWQMLRRYRQYDVVYATNYRGIEPVVLLRALRLFRRPIVLWHHQPVVRSGKWWRERLGRLFYRGMDDLFFFSEKLVADSAATGKVDPRRMHVAQWGPDLDFYDRLLAGRSVEETGAFSFVSSGKELRDMPTLVGAFNLAGAPLDIFLGRNTGGVDYEAVLGGLSLKDNVRVNFVEGLIPWQLAQEVMRRNCVVICCKETNYTVGLTTVVEALGLGMPMIISRNPQQPLDVDAEGCGISVAYGDREGWQKAIEYMQAHPEEARRMGQRGRQIAESRYNLRILTGQVAAVLNKYTLQQT